MAAPARKSGNVIAFDRARKEKRGSGMDVLPALDMLAKKNKLSEGDKKRLARFKKDFRKLREQVGPEAKDLRSDLTQKAMYRAMLSAVLQMIPIAEETFLEKRSESATYAVNSLFNQCKDLATALRNLDDLEEQADYIASRIIHPTMVQFTQNLLTLIINIKGKVDNQNLDPKKSKQIKDSLDNALKAQAAYMNESQRALSHRIKSYLLGDD